MRSTAHHGDDDDPLKSGAAEGFRAFVHGRSGGQHVIDKDGTCRGFADLALPGAAENEGATQVFQPPGAGERRRVRGGAGPLEGVDHRQPGVAGELPGNFLRLVEMAVLEAFVVQGHGHQWPFSREGFRQAGIAKRLGGEAAEFFGEVEFSPVFQAMDHVQGALVADHGGPGEFEEKLQLAAVRASERSFDLSRERLAAALAIGLGESR